jgi:uncharacterized membrane protein
LESVFSPQKVNLGRQLELDVARTLAVVFMVLVHVFTLFVEYPLPETASTHINFLVRLPRRRYSCCCWELVSPIQKGLLPTFYLKEVL